MYFNDKSRKPKRKCVSLKTSRKEVAIARARKLELEYAKGTFDPWNPSDQREILTYTEATEKFIEDKDHLRPKSILAYQEALRGLERLLPPNLPLHAIRSHNIREYVKNPSISSASQRHRFRHLRAFFNWCLERGILEKSPLKGIRLPKQEKRVADFFTVEQFERLIAAILADFKLKRRDGYARDGEIGWLVNLVILAVWTGLRLGELCSLKWNAIDLDNGFLTVKNSSDFRTKTGHERRVPLVGDALKLIQRLHTERMDDQDGHVLIYANGKPLVPSYASKRFKKYVRLARLPEHFRFHSLRHTCASWLVMKGVSLPIVQSILGHSSIQVTERYAHLAPDVVRAAMQRAFELTDSSAQEY